MTKNGWLFLVVCSALFLGAITTGTTLALLVRTNSQLATAKSTAKDTNRLVRAQDDRIAEQDREREAGNQLVRDAINRIQLNTALSVDCAYLRDRGIRPVQCADVNQRIDDLRRDVPIEIPRTTTTTTVRPRSTTTTTRSPTSTIQSTTTPPVPVPTTTTIPPCRGINLLGICIGG